MGNRQQILTELRSISLFLAEMEYINPLSVPEGYFDTLPQVICEKIRVGDKILPDFGSSNTYQIPQGYFEVLSSNILSVIKEIEHSENEIRDELEEMAPLLNTISKETIYRVPLGYFNRTEFISSITKETISAKIVPLQIVKKWVQYAAAAVVVGILVTGAFLFTDNKNYSEFEKYDQLDFPSELTKVEDDELVKYLNSPDHIQNTIADAIPTEGQEVADMENTTIQLVTDAELTHYLTENAESRKAAAPPKNN